MSIIMLNIKPRLLDRDKKDSIHPRLLGWTGLRRFSTLLPQFVPFARRGTLVFVFMLPAFFRQEGKFT